MLPEYAEAVNELRKRQEASRLRVGVANPINTSGVLELALQRADRRERNAVHREGFIVDGPFRYPEHTERLRWARTRDIIMRVSPGQDEDPNYLEMIARQAASVEMILRHEHEAEANGSVSAICDHILLGTIPAFEASAYESRYGGSFYVLISSGLIEFAYQLAKAVVLSWKPIPRANGPPVSFSPNLEDIDEVLSRYSYPLELFKRTLTSYLFDGRPRIERHSSPPSHYHPPLSILVNTSERFVIAHEYGHALHEARDVVYPEMGPTNEEFSSDIFAFYMLAQSGLVLDKLPPNFSLQGGFFVLTVMNIIKDALDLVRFGEVHANERFSSHPPPSNRIALWKQLYLDQVSSQDDSLSIRIALFPCRTLESLWVRIREQCFEEWPSSQALHPIWDGA